MPVAPTNLVPAFFLFFIGWRVISRVRRNVGRQRLRPIGMIARIVIYAIITLMLGFSCMMLASKTLVFLGLLGGLVLGAGLGLYGLHLTRFESTPEGRFYTPNPYMGVGISMLLVARLGYRFLVLTGPAAQPQMQPQLFQSPLTYLVFGMLAGYYMAYFAGVLARSHELRPPPI